MEDAEKRHQIEILVLGLFCWQVSVVVIKNTMQNKLSLNDHIILNQKKRKQVQSVHVCACVSKSVFINCLVCVFVIVCCTVAGIGKHFICVVCLFVCLLKTIL